MTTIQVFDTSRALLEAAAREVASTLGGAIEERGVGRLALAGGSTPRPLYALLARPPHRQEIEWRRVHLFWGDERCVSPTHPDSNYRIVEEALLHHLPILPPDNVHRILGELPPREAAERYEGELRRCFAAEPPRFDLVLLGMGADGHTASLFPGSPALEERQRWAVAVWSPSAPHPRVTLTVPILNAARRVLFVVAGHRKAPAVARALAPRPEGPEEPGREPPPAARVRPSAGDLLWYLDRRAASRLAR